MLDAAELEVETNNILTTLTDCGNASASQAIANAVGAVVRAISTGSTDALVRYASEEAVDSVTAAECLFAACTAALRRIDMLAPSQFARIDRTLLSGRHLAARLMAVNSALGMTA